MVLLPGLDGTGTLFRRFLEQCPEQTSATVVSFPTDRVHTCDELAALVRGSLPPTPRILLGESFSGPLALRLANAVEAAGVVLCATFVKAPVPRALSFTTPLSFLLRARPPLGLIAALLTGGDKDLAREVADAVSKVEREVIASRIRMVLEIDARQDLADCPCPVLYLNGLRDRIVGSGALEPIREIRGDVAVNTVDAPHLVLQARPSECWSAIALFVETVCLSPAHR